MAADSVGRQRLRHFLDAVLTVGSELDLPVVLRRIVEAATELMGATYGALGVLREDRAGLAEFVTVGLTDEQVRLIGDPPKGHGLLGLLIVDPKPIRTADISRHPDRFGFPPHHPPMRSFLGVPIKVSDRVFGNLYLADKREGAEFTADDEELAVALASVAGMAVENARLHDRLADMALLEDRERIARDLHDTVMQRLYAAGLTLQSALRRADPDVGGRLEQAIDDIDAVIRDIRTTIFELRTTRSTTRSLRREFAVVAGEAARTLGFEPTLRFDGPIDTFVPEEVGDQAVIVLREALGNVARHARAHRAEVTVSVTTEPPALRLQITDDGVGMPASERPAGHGLRNIASRAGRLGGRADIDSSPNQGTTVRWEVPLATPA